MPVLDQQLICSPPCLARAQSGVAAALWHYTATQVAKPYYVRGSIPDPDQAAVIVALWTGPAAREKTSLFFLVPLVSGGLPVPAVRVVAGMLRLRRGTHLFGTTGRRFDGRPVLNGSDLVEGRALPCLCGGIGGQPGPRGFSFERPGELKRYH
ncbi:hypothetical protein HUT19_34940 [Streptomyces sp. NA02950]|uniref:hypothetical protein n=1 Tax=Streptomyces sp. NA02950 TaxID=2742137 RepID=UPI00158FA2A1|nr:hypothetical protein [Streptomyces sp. NA02950]QKV96278.1 hypothetical protein HUT19_34940 [Streptomyces sp. NA02950]